VQAEECVSKATTTAGPKPDNALVRYLKETRAELRKVTWPTRQQAINLTIIVLGVTIVMAIFLGAVDLVFASIMLFLAGGR
jgi:preprotein translocase subunit SecE